MQFNGCVSDTWPLNWLVEDDLFAPNSMRHFRRQPIMKDFNLKPALAAAMVVGSLCAVSVRAGDLDVGGNLGVQSSQNEAMSTVSSDDKWVLLAPFAVPHVNIDVSGPDSSGTMPYMALGPQYSLNSKITLGGTWEGHDTIAFGAHPDNDPYTFGVRVVF
jgi:hypothetical protein